MSGASGGNQGSTQCPGIIGQGSMYTLADVLFLAAYN